MVEPLPLVVGEKEQLVLNDGSANRPTEHIPAEFRLGYHRRRVEPIFPLVCIQHVVPEELEYITVETIGTGLDRRADDASLEIPEFGGCILGNHIEFLNGINTGSKAHEIVRNLVVVHPIE